VLGSRSSAPVEALFRRAQAAFGLYEHLSRRERESCKVLGRLVAAVDSSRCLPVQLLRQILVLLIVCVGLVTFIISTLLLFSSTLCSDDQVLTVAQVQRVFGGPEASGT
jgi:hypothetical protein